MEYYSQISPSIDQSFQNFCILSEKDKVSEYMEIENLFQKYMD